MWLLVVVGAIVFQNISCYCLTAFLHSSEQYFALFQNISCYCLTGERGQERTDPILISKHLMLLFNKMENNCHLFYYYISKHLMLLFNWEQVADRLNIKVISKHLMLLFNSSS